MSRALITVGKWALMLSLTVGLLSCCVWLDDDQKNSVRRHREKAYSDFGTHFKIVSIEREKVSRNKKRFTEVVGESTTTQKTIRILIERDTDVPCVGQVIAAYPSSGDDWYATTK